MSYIPLHTHTHFSLFDGIATPEEYTSRAFDVGMPAIAITDHGSLTGHREFYRNAKGKGIKPILGVEGYITQDRFDQRDSKDRSEPLDLVYNHIIILAKNQEGLENLNKLNEIAWTEGFYKKPRIDYEVLEKYRSGLIVTSGCLSGAVAKAVEAGEMAEAKRQIQWHKDTFGDDYYIEVMPHNPPEINHQLLALADEFGVKPVVTPDCHHAHSGQKEIQELKLILNTYSNKVQKDATYEKSKKHESLMERLDYLYGADRQMTFKDFEIHLLSDEEMRAAMLSQGIDREDIYENTKMVADKVEDYEINDHLDLLPVQYKNPNKELRDLAIEGLKARGLEGQEYLDRLEEEMKVIEDKNFGPYFLVVRNMIAWAKKEGIMVGPGRGSSAGSLLCYTLGITDIDPIKYGLLFFRFINPERNDFPDIDTDIQDSRREEVKDYLVRQYRHVASIATFLQFRGKGMVRDIARVLHIPLTDVNKVLKTVDDWDDYCLSKSSAWFREKYPEVEQYGDLLRGRIRGTGIHAAGVVTSKEPIFRHAPMETRNSPGSGERIPVVAVDMEEAEKIGLIKIDALGLKTLSVIKDTIDLVDERYGKKISLLDINLDDSKVYEMLSAGHTKGVFQCEATPYTNLLVKMGVKNFDELAASNALVRPGAMNTIGKDYIDRKHGKQQIAFSHQALKDFTSDTYGCILYQEQVMQACVQLGGMSMAEADKVRKIIGKKKDAKEFDQFKDKFVEGASRYLSPNRAAEMWHDFEAHAGYSFNKSHAVAYSTLSYWTAWLKYYYPIEFIFSILNNEKDKDVRTEYLIEAKRMGIPIRLPHINESDVDFKIEGKAIRFGLSGIKYISDVVAKRYIEARPFNSYKDLELFTTTKGNGVNSRSLNAMRIIGAATFEDNPRDEDEIRSNLYEYLNLPEFNLQVPTHYTAWISQVEDFEEKGAFILMGMARSIKRGKGWSRIEVLDKTGSVGIFDEEQTKIETGKTYIFLASDNRIIEAIPLEDVSDQSNSLIKFLNYKMLPYSGDELYVVSFKPRITKAGKKMAYITLADTSRSLHPVTVFPMQFADAYMKIKAGNAYRFKFGKTKDGTVIFNELL